MPKNKSLSFLLGFFIIACLLVSQQLSARAKQTGVLVEQEPHHRIVFQNRYVRIYDAVIPPGDVTLFHIHSCDSVSIAVSGGKAIKEFQGKPPIRSDVPTGWVGFRKANNAPYTHRLTNIGPTPLRFVVPEILSSSGFWGVPAALDTVPGHKYVLENDLVKVYRVSIDPKQSTGVHSHTLPWLRISITQSRISVQTPGKSPEILETKPGDYRWYEGRTKDSIENVGSTKYEAVEIQLK
jgi:hypothetical protein